MIKALSSALSLAVLLLAGGCALNSSFNGKIAGRHGFAEVFVPSATRRMELSAEAQMAALRQLGEEYGHPALGWFDRLVNGVNRPCHHAPPLGRVGHRRVVLSILNVHRGGHGCPLQC